MKPIPKEISDEIYNRYTKNDFVMDRPRYGEFYAGAGVYWGEYPDEGAKPLRK